MGRYFGREPRYSREEIERQAQEAIDARISLGRPPDEDFRPLQARLDDLDQAIVSRPPVEPLPEPVPEPQPVHLREVRLPSAPAAKPRMRRPVVARPPAN